MEKCANSEVLADYERKNESAEKMQEHFEKCIHSGLESIRREVKLLRMIEESYEMDFTEFLNDSIEDAVI